MCKRDMQRNNTYNSKFVVKLENGVTYKLSSTGPHSLHSNFCQKCGEFRSAANIQNVMNHRCK